MGMSVVCEEFGSGQLIYAQVNSPFLQVRIRGTSTSNVRRTAVRWNYQSRDLHTPGQIAQLAYVVLARVNCEGNNKENNLRYSTFNFVNFDFPRQALTMDINVVHQDSNRQ